MADATWISDEAYLAYNRWMDNVLVDPKLNEDTTRMRMIDAILFDVLKWDRNFVLTEPHVKNEGYADYILHTKGGRTLVLEAKKVGATFLLPDREPYPGRAVPFQLISDKCPDAHKAMQQGVTYANSVGARYTVISNGQQWLLMLTAVEGALLAERNVIVFESLRAISDRFELFWNCFSPLMVQVNKPHLLLVDTRHQPAPAKLAQTVPQYPVRREGSDIRNQHATSIQYIWDEVNNNEASKTFFEECYVPPVGHDKNTGLAAQLLWDRSAEDTAAYEKVHASQMTELLKNPPRPERPVILLGRIGRGKSTFIKYLKVIAAEQTLRKYIQIDIDFLDRPRTKGEVAAFVYDAVRDQLHERYGIDVSADDVVRAALRAQLNQFRKTPRAKLYLDAGDEQRFKEAELDYLEEQTRNVHHYLKLVTQLIRGSHGKSIAIYFDNLDKRGDLQEEAFLIASSIARDWAAIDFICLRPGTFQRSRNLGVLDSIAPRLIQVYPPPTALFLKRRFEYCSKIAAGEKPPPRGSEALSKAIAQEGSEVSALFRALSDSVRRDKDLVTLFESVSNGNLRDVLFRVGATITSWHLDTAEMIEGIRESGTYYVTHHQALRALLYGASLYFDPARSPLVNLFEIEHADPIDHFLRPICLFHLSKGSRETADLGFTSYAEVAALVGNYSFTPDAIETTLQFLFAKRLVEDDNFNDEWPGTNINLRLTALGHYHISDLIVRFEYRDAVVVDTPIIDPSASGEIKLVDSIGDRLLRGRAFLRYLNNCAQSVANTPFYAHWERVHEAAANELTDIEATVARG
ncbi:MAG TPA: hypothetical protein VF669_03975 [Tepidisphaeraceae bacterium]|jgi:hypothetical protein